MKTGKEGQVEPPDGEKDKERSEQDMDKTHFAHEEFIHRFTGGDRERIGDIKAGHNQYKY